MTSQDEADAAARPDQERPGERPGPDPAYAIGFLLRLAHVRAARMFTEALAPLGIEGRHFAVLATLAHADVAMSQRQLYDQVRSDKASMVRVIDDLEALGLVVRAPAAGDRRVRAVTLTEHGRHVCATAATTAEQVATRLLGQLEATEREQLVGLLRRIAHPAADTSTAVRTSAAVTGPR